MSGDLSAVDKSIADILIDLMTEKFMSARIQAPLTGAFQASPSVARRSSRITIEKISKHRDDLENVKQILSVLPDYIPPLAGVVSHDSVLHDLKYTLITAYLPKGIRAIGL
jgi:hypothetical protein